MHVGDAAWVAPHADRQQVIDEVNESGGGFALFNHPNWHGNFNHCPQELLQACEGYVGLEIYNGVICRLEGSPYRDESLGHAAECGEDACGGLPTTTATRRKADVGLGWNVAYVEEETASGVVEALRAGRFYASTGVEISQIQVEGNRIWIETENAARIVALYAGAKRIAVADGREIEVESARAGGIRAL